MVVFPESGWEIMARLRRRSISGRRVVVMVGGGGVLEEVEWRVVWWGRGVRGVKGVKAWRERGEERDRTTVAIRRLRRLSAILSVVCALMVSTPCLLLFDARRL